MAFFELHYTLNGHTECVSGLFSTADNAQRYKEGNQSLSSAHVVEVKPRPLTCPCCGGHWDHSQKAYWDPSGYTLGKGWHRNGAESYFL